MDRFHFQTEKVRKIKIWNLLEPIGILEREQFNYLFIPRVFIAQWFLTWVRWDSFRGTVVWRLIGEYEEEKSKFYFPTTKGSINA